MSALLVQPCPETTVSLVTSNGETAIAAGDYVASSISYNLEARLMSLREAAQIAVDANGTVEKQEALEQLAFWLVITAPLADATNSTVETSDARVPADGTTATITVTLIDRAANPVIGRPVSLTSSNAEDVISDLSGVSDASGVVTFTVSSESAATSTFTATASGDAVTITDTAEIEFTTPA